MSEPTRIPLAALVLSDDYQPPVESLDGALYSERHVKQLMQTDPTTWGPITVTPTGDGSDAAPKRASIDPTDRLVRRIDHAEGLNPNAVPRAIETYVEEDRVQIARTVAAFGAACTVSNRSRKAARHESTNLLCGGARTGAVHLRRASRRDMESDHAMTR